jgi:hypothetical protein
MCSSAVYVGGEVVKMGKMGWRLWSGGRLMSGGGFLQSAELMMEGGRASQRRHNSLTTPTRGPVSGSTRWPVNVTECQILSE